MRGLTSTSRPFVVVAFRWPVTSTTTIRTSSPSCVAASPTQWPNASIVSTRSSLTRAISPASRASARDLLERGVRIDEDLADHWPTYMTSGSSGRTVTSTPCSAPTSASIAASAFGLTSSGSATSSTIA